MEDSTHLFRLLVALTAAIGLMVVDFRTPNLQPVRSALSMLAYPIVLLADLPSRSDVWLSANLDSGDEMQDSLMRLRAELLVQKGHLQRMDALETENGQLRTLLSAASQLPNEVAIAELLRTFPDASRRLVLIDQGSVDGVYLGQAVLDAEGVLGQVSQLGPFSATVILLTDARHAIPVQVKRTGVRAVVVGTGVRDRLELHYLSMEADILPGDLLLSSGLGGRFPEGYPVGLVGEKGIRADIPMFQVIPSAGLDKGRMVLLVRTKERPGGDKAPQSSILTKALP